MKRGEVAMARVRSISHTHPQTDSTDHASESSVCVCVWKPQNRRTQPIPSCAYERFLQTQTLVYIQSMIFKSVPKNNDFDVWNVCLHFSTSAVWYQHAKFSNALLKFSEGNKKMLEPDCWVWKDKKWEQTCIKQEELICGYICIYTSH